MDFASLTYLFKRSRLVVFVSFRGLQNDVFFTSGNDTSSNSLINAITFHSNGWIMFIEDQGKTHIKILVTRRERIWPLMCLSPHKRKVRSFDLQERSSHDVMRDGFSSNKKIETVRESYLKIAPSLLVSLTICTILYWFLHEMKSVYILSFHCDRYKTNEP